MISKDLRKVKNKANNKMKCIILDALLLRESFEIKKKKKRERIYNVFLNKSMIKGSSFRKSLVHLRVKIKILIKLGSLRLVQ